MARSSSPLGRRILRQAPLSCGILMILAAGRTPAFGVQDEARATRPPSEQDRIRDAEELLRQLRRKTTTGDVIPPASAAGPFPAPAKAKLLPEGTAVVAMPGDIRLDGEWWVFTPRGGAADARECRLLPNSTLEAMVRMTKAARGTMPFNVSGELTVFRGENYLLARSAVRALPPAAASHRDDHPPADAQPDRDAGAGQDRGADPPPAAMTDAPEAPTWDADPKDVLNRMREVAPQMPAVLPPKDEPAPLPARPRVRTATRYLEGTSLVGRSGRLVREGPGWALAFDSDQPEPSDEAFRLLPNKSLEFMTDAAEKDPAGLRFVVSGEITEFENENFVLVRAVTRPLDAGNLRH